MFKHSSIISALIISTPIFLSGCGSDSGGGSIAGLSYNGETAAVVINADNAETMATTSTEAATQAISEQVANESNPFAMSVNSISLPSDEVNKAIATIINSIQNQPDNLVTAITLGPADLSYDPYYCGGSITMPDNASATSGSMSFSNFCYNLNGQMIMNGAIQFSQTATTLSVKYTNFTVSFEGESFTINNSMTCDLDQSGFITTCTISSLYTGTDGLTYQIENHSVFGNSTFGFYVDATFYHPTYGSVVITTTSPILLGCAGPQPGSGSISFTGDAGTTGSISFDSCSGYTYCYDLGGGPICNSGTW